MALDIQIPGYQIKEEIGRGGMATVYRALQESLNRDVALKIMNPSLAVDDGFKKRFHNEGHIIARLSHSNIVTIFDIGDFQQYYYFSMEFLPGGTLREKINQGLPLTEALETAKILAKALGFAHREDVIHRDIKPPNVLFRADLSPVLTDFGIAKMPSEVTQMTAAGYTFGSAGYMSPEQSLGNPLDHRSDLYSLGVLFWEMLTGNKPYNADNTFALAYKHATEPVPELPDNLSSYQTLLNKLLAKRPDDRFDTAEDFAVALETLQFELSPSGSLQAQSNNTSDITQIRATKTAAKTGISQTQKLASEKRSSTLTIGLVAAGVLLIGAAAAYFAISQDPLSDSSPQTNDNNPVVVAPATSPQTSASQAAEQSNQTAAATNNQTSASSSNPNVDKTPATTTTTTTAPLGQASASPSIANQHLEKAQQFMAEDAWEQSLEQIKTGLREAPEHEELLALHSEIQAQLSVETDEARTKRQISRLLAKAQRQWDNLQFEEPAGDNASETYRQVLQLEPSNEEARSGMQRIGRMRLVVKSQQKAQQLLQEGKLEESLAEIEKGLILSPGYDGLLELRDEVELRLKNR